MSEPRTLFTLADYTEAARQRILFLERWADEIREREAACCPEDVGFDEYIRALERRSAELEAVLERAHAEARVCFDAGVTFGFGGGIVHAGGKPAEEFMGGDVSVPSGVLCDVYWSHWAGKVKTSPLVGKWVDQFRKLEAALWDVLDYVDVPTRRGQTGTTEFVPHALIERLRALATQPPHDPDDSIPWPGDASVPGSDPDATIREVEAGRDSWTEPETPR